jgi:hypothetical protein
MKKNMKKSVVYLLMTVVVLTVTCAADSFKQDFKMNTSSYVPFDATTTVTLECPNPEGAKWVRSHFAQWFGKASPKVFEGVTSLLLPEPPADPKADAHISTYDEAYAAKVDASGVKIKARSLAGVRWACNTLRQLAIAKRGTFKLEGRILPELTIVDKPHLAFRAVHLCWFPETRGEQIERAIRLAALLKFNYAIVEPWGTYKSEKHPWFAWPNAPLNKKELKRLVAIGRDLGITLIPQVNCYGHASFSRGCTKKHSTLDLNPEYEPLFEPGGWVWCIMNQETQRVLREIIAEIHEDFGNPPYFHIGCDEAFNAQTCPLCVKGSHSKQMLNHINGLSDFLKSRGARAMMWHDMLLDKADPRWRNFVKFGSKESASIIDSLSRDIIICDWQYSYDNMKKKHVEWPTISYFADKGLSVVGCPWMNYQDMMPMAQHIVNKGGFGFVETTWHRLRGDVWEKMFMSAGHAAWGSPVSHGVSFERSLRLIGADMKINNYLDTGHMNHQIPPTYNGN